MWKSPALRTLLARGPAFKVVPVPSTKTETFIAQRRAAISIVASIRREIRARAGEDPVLSACDPSARPESGRQWHASLGLKEGTWARARALPDGDLGEWNDRVFRELERGVGIPIEGAGGARIRVGEIPDLAAAIDLWLAQGDAIDVGLVDQDPPEGRPSNLDKSEYEMLDCVRERPEDLSVSDPDKGPGTILSTKLSLQTRARAHALSSSYERSF
jgi:hypothetical protein